MKLNSSRLLILADCHFPFQNNEAITRALKEGKQYRPDTIILNGDILDAYSVSHWMTDPALRNFKKELDATKAFLKLLRKHFPKQRIVYKFANHEHRLQAYLFTHAQELTELEEIKLPSLLNIKSLDIEMVDRQDIIVAGKYTIIHGDEVKLSGAYPAKVLFSKTHTNCIASHVHRPTDYYVKTINGHIYRTYTTPCLCQLKAEFAPYNQWQNGYCTLTDGVVHTETF